MDSSVTRSSTIVRSLSFTGKTLRSQLWIWPLVAAAGLAIIGLWLRATVERAVKEKMASELQTILNAEKGALEIWIQSQEANVSAAAEHEPLPELVEKIVELAKADESTVGALSQAASAVELRKRLAPFVKQHGYSGFAVWDGSERIIAGDRDDVLLRHVEEVPTLHQAVRRAQSGEANLCRPYKSIIVLSGEDNRQSSGVPTMFALAPVRDAAGQIIAVFGLRIRPEIDFTRILSIARLGKSGETYVFDHDGVMLSQSRFDDELKRIGLLVDREGERSILNLEVRDPQVDMTQGKRPQLRRPEQPLTRMAESAVAGKAGVDVEGYRDYRGVPVVGVWEWLPEHGFGIATEVDVAEAYGPLRILRSVFWGLFGLLAAGSVVLFVFMLFMQRMQTAMRKAVIAAKQLGQYTLDQQIGAGGMGVVFKAHHALLRRPTAVKLLSAERTNQDSVARFEREVQLTSQLNHPNTIVIYDYGRTPVGVFYYAMEFLEGLSLESFVERYGRLPEGRVIHLLKQICGSLAEAHGVGLIHRDIKPANIMLTRRGGLCDFVKVLDFGLVRAVNAQRNVAITAPSAVNGTPQYLSPEGIERPDEVDARGDLYAVGAVGYFLLTGTPVFNGRTPMEVCLQQVRDAPQRPGERLGGPVSPDLEAIILRCLAKSPSDRPASAAELLDALSRCQSASLWSTEEAALWWSDSAVGDTGKVHIKSPTVHLQETMALQEKSP